MSDKHSIIYPDLKTLLPHQIKLLKAPERFQVINWHRRARKTTTSLIKLVLEAINPDLPPQVYWHISPTFSMAKENIWKSPGMLFNERVLPKKLIRKTNESELTVYLANGSLIVLKSADDPDRLRGGHAFGVVLDEAAQMDSVIFPEIIEPILRASEGSFCWIISTPKGRNWFYEFYLRGKDPNNKEWRSSKLKASNSNILTAEQLKLAKQGMPAPLFNQEFLCAFLEG